MMYKGSVLSVGRYRNYESDQEQFGEELLVQMFLSTDEVDELIVDRTALQLAQQQLDGQRFVAGMPRHRVLPPRRHLRNK